MANPNLYSELNTVYGDTVGSDIATSGTQIITNLTTDSIYKINSFMVTNLTSGNDSVTIKIDNFFICKDLVIPGGSSVIIIDKSAPFYLKESSYLQATSLLGDASLHGIASYDILAKV